MGVKRTKWCVEVKDKNKDDGIGGMGINQPYDETKKMVLCVIQHPTSSFFAAATNDNDADHTMDPLLSSSLSWAENEEKEVILTAL